MRNDLENGRLEHEGDPNEKRRNNVSQPKRLIEHTDAELNNLNRKYISFNDFPENINSHENQNLDSFGNISKYD